ncbi:MAG: FecR family protein [Lentisphaeraceae bacterium]|nr:FecR family protein [Lentisphaeraceae bacterium]
MTDQEEIQDLLSKILCEEMSDDDVIRLSALSQSNPELLVWIAEQVAFHDLISQNLATERTEKCFVEMVKSSIAKKDGKTRSKDDAFVNSVKNKLQLEKSRTTKTNKQRRTIAPRSKQQPKKKSKKPLLMTMLAFAAIIAVTTVVLVKMPAADNRTQNLISQVSVYSGDVGVNDKRLSAGDRVTPGSFLRIFSKEAVLKMDDGTLVTVFEGALIRYDEGKDRRFLLTNGKLDAFVKKQKNGPLFFETPYSEAEILGTEFTLMVYGDRDVLDVKEGLINYKSIKSKEDMLVKTGQRSTVYRSGTIRIRKPQRFTGDITGMYLLDKENKNIQEVFNDDRLSLRKIGKDFNLGVELSRNVELILFVVNGRLYKDTGLVSFRNGSVEGKVLPWHPKPGEYTIKMMPFDRYGRMLKQVTAKFKVED